MTRNPMGEARRQHVHGPLISAYEDACIIVRIGLVPAIGLIVVLGIATLLIVAFTGV